MKFIEVIDKETNTKLIVNVESITTIEKLVNGKARITTTTGTFELKTGFNKVMSDIKE